MVHLAVHFMVHLTVHLAVHFTIHRDTLTSASWKYSSLTRHLHFAV